MSSVHVRLKICCGTSLAWRAQLGATNSGSFMSSVFTYVLSASPALAKALSTDVVFNTFGGHSAKGGCSGCLCLFQPLPAEADILLTFPLEWGRRWLVYEALGHPWTWICTCYPVLAAPVRCQVPLADVCP